MKITALFYVVSSSSFLLCAWKLLVVLFSLAFNFVAFYLFVIGCVNEANQTVRFGLLQLLFFFIWRGLGFLLNDFKKVDNWKGITIFVDDFIIPWRLTIFNNKIWVDLYHWSKFRIRIKKNIHKNSRKSLY